MVLDVLKSDISVKIECPGSRASPYFARGTSSLFLNFER